jgi:hypothetical protein
MGLDKIISYLSKNLPFNSINELSYTNNINKVVGDKIFIDFNFIVYSNLNDLEEELNEIIKIILSLPYVDIKILNNKLEKIFDTYSWNGLKDTIINILDGENQKEIINNFNNFLNVNNLETLKFNKIYDNIVSQLENIHHMEFIKGIYLFMDGIPSYSKVLEQRRRRTKNYLESLERKVMFKEYFDKIDNTIYRENEYVYDYFNYLDNKIVLEKSFGPNSIFVNKLLVHLEDKFKSLNIKNFYVSGGDIYGEADMKIFMYIDKHKLKDDLIIHTCDSDIVHLILVRQCYAMINQENTRYKVIRYYSKNSKSLQLIDGEYIINQLGNIYKDVYSVDTINLNTILDFLFICLLFGNDHIPNNSFIGSEISIENYFYYLKNSLNSDNILNITNNLDKKSLINYINLSKFLNYMRTKNLELKIYLSRYFNLDNNSINLLYDCFKNYSVEQFNCLMKEYLKSNKMDVFLIDNIDEKKLENLEKLLKRLIINKNYNFLGEISFKSDIGFEYFNRGLTITNDPFQDLYNYVCEKSYYKSFLKNNIYYKNDCILSNTNKQSNVENYLLMLDYLTNIYFNNFNKFDNYNPLNLIYYEFDNSPSLNEIIDYLDKNTKLDELFLKKINNNFIDKDNYFDNLSHLLFITPYLSFTDFFDKTTLAIYNQENRKIIFEELKEFFLDMNNVNFNYRKLDVKKFISIWKNINININIIV